jgi:DNA primase
MGIVDEDIARVRDSTDIVAIISEHVQLKRVGRRWSGLCPFHAEKSPSFSVNQEEGFYKCFGCGVGGDAITFVREIDHLDFVAAVESLAAKANITLRYTDRDAGEGRKQRGRMSGIMREAVEWYHERLLDAPDAATARGYLRSRGLTGDEVRRYQLGWAPEGWDELARALKIPSNKDNDRYQLFEGVGLGFLNRNGKVTDAFRGRVLFPIFDVNGEPVAFGGRVLPGSTDNRKYKNSSETKLYAKSKTLYGLNWAKAAVVNADQVIVCEGYTDVIGFAAAGMPRAVATCGTSLTEEHFRVLKSYAHNIVLAFDADSAGQNAAERFYEWERQYEIDVAVAALPPGVDPADLARTDPDALRTAVDDAVPFLGFRVNRVLDGANTATPEGRARAAEQALAVVAEHPRELVRDQYVMEIASRTRIEPDRLRSMLAGADGHVLGGAGPGRGKAVARDRNDAVSVGSTATGRPMRESAELEALRLLVISPAEIGPWLHEELFTDDRARAAYLALSTSGSLRAAIDTTDPGAAELLQQVAVEDSNAEPLDVAVRLLYNAGQRRLVDLRAQAQSATVPEDVRWTADAQGWLKLRMEELLESSSNEAAAGQLLAWLTEEPEEQQ